ncbi:MAG: hypothetical protein IT376_13500 [Polyangiaceae bacterium]|nr:hypothetical protein [Polyangiaceae bacterium]
MCRRVTCKRCGRPSYEGCGAHIEQVLGDVPRERRCRCRERAAAEGAEPRRTERPFWKLWG